ncbi:hypothetical protein [Micromonospora avicenniae]|uniref:hypothetical protein n=1 Tax=Micromonospora avicenniae TaxID=1198245 RepID=UPI00111566BD|nr:hypothetical protein [Micromonospora avicenniae]
MPSFVVMPGDAECWFTVNIRITDSKSGETMTLNLTDSGQPFVLRGRTTSSRQHAYFEMGSIYS